ncbi:Chromo domain-containing protein [Trichostrongylus colubriformis]|uniref:Chromo domain-containing protein n=1 Tax=Trichostrongylus colubriformis TaxID=6319 RepID=A0AAN8FYX2_TRICO
MAGVKRNLCRRRYDELSDKFFAEVYETCRRHRYKRDDVDRSMKRLLKIAEFRDPTPNDMNTSTALANITKEHLELFYAVFRNLAERPVEDIIVTDEASTESCSNSDRENNEIEEDLFSSEVPQFTTEDLNDISSDTEEEQFEVERIISRTVNADGKFVYHIKWKGYETSSDPENFVDEENMHCPELIEEFERLERRKKKERAKKLEEQAIQAKKRKLEAERRAKAAFRSTLGSSNTNEEFHRKSCREINLCSSTSASEEENAQSCAKPRTGGLSDVKDKFLFQSSNRQFKKPKDKHKASSNLQKQIDSTASSSEDDELEVASARKQSREGWRGKTMNGSKSGTSECESVDPDAAFKFIMRETDGLKKGYKVVKVSVVCEHPITKEVVAVVVFKDPLDGHEFAQYIPFRETHLMAPLELRHYFMAANNADPKNLALSLLLQRQKPIKSS